MIGLSIIESLKEGSIVSRNGIEVADPVLVCVNPLL